MKSPDQKTLMNQLTEYGYPLMKRTVTAEPEQVMEDLLAQEDVRLLEGFPVVLAHALKRKESLKWENKKWRPDALPKKRNRRMVYLLALSYYLFRLFGLDQEFLDRTLKLLSKMNGKETLVQLNEPFTASQSVVVDRLKLSTERLKNTFRNYLVDGNGSAEAEKKRRVLELELLLSELFTPRQKQLLKKRLENKPMTKTEREYFYRVVSKRLKALASEELHQMARELVSR